MPERDEHDSVEGTFLSHLIELRNRAIYAVGAVLGVFCALVYFARDIYVIVAQPLMAVLPKDSSMIATEPAAPFFIPIKLTFAVAVVIALPYVLYQLWAFVAPGLYKHERRLIVPLLVSSTLLFYLGMAFAYFVVLPIAFGFFTRYAPAGVLVMTDIGAYLNFVLRIFFVFGIAFEVPIAIILLTRMGALDPDALAKQRPYILIGIFTVAMLLTPPDVFSQTLLAIPMLLLFEIGIFFGRRMRPKEATEEVEPATGASLGRDVGGKTGPAKARRRRSKRR